MNKELLFQLYEIFSPSGREKKMCKFICDYIRKSGQDIKITRDAYKNIYVTKGDAENYPCVVAHLDQVSYAIHSKDFKAYEIDGMAFGYSKKNKRFENLGADDKNGIFVALECLMNYPVMKCAFFREEEVGTIGSSHADMSFFDNCRFVLQCDRRNGYDLITNGGFYELCSREFIKAIHPEAFGYQETVGALTDVITLKENGLNVSCVNMSCGYYNPHRDEETTVLDELENCLNFVKYIVENCTEVYPHMDSFYDVRTDDFWYGDQDDSLEDEIYDFLCSNEGEDVEELYTQFAEYYPQCEHSTFMEIARLVY